MGNLIGCRIVEIYLETHLGIFFRLQRCKEILGFSKEWYAPPGSTNLATKHKRSEEWQCVAMSDAQAAPSDYAGAMFMQGRIRTRRTASSEPLLVDPEIEKTARRNNSATRRRRAQAQQVAHHSSASDTLSSTSHNPDPLPEEEMTDNPHGDGRGQKRKERIYSHYFLTKDNEDRFEVVMQRKLVAERKVLLKPREVNEFQLALIRRGWERLGSYPSTFSVTLVKDFYANAKVTTSAAPTVLSYVRGKRVPFDADTINESLGTQLADDVECQFSVLDDEGVAPGELIQALCLAGEGFHRGTIQRGSLHPLARFWSAFVHANISPCSHVSDLTEGRATILYTILTGRVMDVGQFIANEIHRCANAAGKAALGHPSLITHLCSLAGVDISVPPLEKATQDLDFSYFQRSSSKDAGRG
ncbi:hypothetical protein DEO72_LG11g1226 [Vigna unguiculata]|uniref:Putative plant transposon protein domain-containing protein n=1 Tax=Vigna unguiculata TaxID=3917 RepID=A0A4D6NR18_VIGUN|nr:hypothetical protein DEO72_LG11g1226 [Vigna unguiculata]